jgi:hypothetical protein
MLVACSAQIAIATPQLAYVNGGKVYLRRADGSGTIKKVKTGSLPNGLLYSPSGERLAIQEGRYDAAWTDDLQVYELSTGKLRTVIAGGPFQYGPRIECWSPNGRYLVYTRYDRTNGYYYDTSRRRSYALPMGEQFRWSYDGSKVAFLRGQQLLVMAAPNGTPTLLKDLSPWVGTNSLTIEWAEDSLGIYVGYRDGADADRVFLAGTDGSFFDVDAGPWGWRLPRSRSGNWVAPRGTMPPAISDGVTTYVVGPNKATASVESMSSDGQWVSLMDWWGGSGQWNVWTCKAGATPKNLGTGFWNELRPSPLVTLSRPGLPYKVQRDYRVLFSGSESLANTNYPGPGTVRVLAQKYINHKWRTRVIESTALSGAGASITYAGNIRLSKGSWRVRAERPVSASAPKVVSSWRYVKSR